MSGDLTVLGRYGTRTSMENAERDVTVEGFAETLQEILKLHYDFDAIKASLKGKQNIDLGAKKPEEFSELARFKKTLDWEGEVTRSCIHCHQIGDALRNDYRRKGEPLPDHLMFPFPPPQTVGIKIDPKTAAKIIDVAEGSAAEKAGIRAGDKLVSIDQQPITSTADVQWILHRAKPIDSLNIVVQREGKPVESELSLVEDWRRENDVSWRPTSWNLRRLATGGIRFATLPDRDRERMSIKDGEMALLAKHVGLYGSHAVAHRAGVKKGDVIIAIDGKRDLMSETDVLYHSMQQKKSGDTIHLVIVRGKKRFEVKFRLP